MTEHQAYHMKCQSLSGESYHEVARTMTLATAPRPPRLWTRPRLASLTWRLPARPRSWFVISPIIRRPEAPIGCPHDLRPPLGLIGSAPSREETPSSMNVRPSPC